VLVFETILALLLGATILSLVARRANVPYPTLLALAGTGLAFLPGAPRLDLPPDLILALFVAPVLLDAAHDTSLRDLRRNWLPLLSLVLVAVGLTTFVVAVVVRHLVPDFSWAAAIALGALLAPPDAVAALAVLQQVRPPYRIRSILEGESLLNDASALLIYKFAVGVAVGGAFSLSDAFPTVLVVMIGSVAVGWLLAWPVVRLTQRMDDAPTSVILQFVATFVVWLIAERLGLSAVVTIVVFGLTAARYSTLSMPARLRVPSFAIWGTVTFVLNVLAFTLIGLQLRPILDRLNGAEGLSLLLSTVAIVGAVIVIRLIWVMMYAALPRISDRTSRFKARAKSGLVIGWSGMRGIVTLAAAMALPAEFPHRDFMQLAAFVVVVGTLVIQGLTLRPLLLLLRLPNDNTVRDEVSLARSTALKAAISALQDIDAPAAKRLMQEYAEALELTSRGSDPHDTSDNALRARVLSVTRQSIDDLRRKGAIGDEAYRRVEEELDWLELSAGPGQPATS
jgi:monovalent cation/hydrogen antiporter